MKSHLAILLWATDPDMPHLCVAPFFHAATAAAMDVEVEIHFASKSVLLLVEGVAAELHGSRDRAMSVHEHMRQAAQFGAKFYACSEALDTHGVRGQRLIAEVSGVAGAAAFVGRVLDPQWATLVY